MKETKNNTQAIETECEGTCLNQTVTTQIAARSEGTHRSSRNV